jgi:potassium-transporting ATPase KdpC subunit
MKEARRIAGLIIFFMLLCGLVYPLLMTGAARVTGKRADGDIMTIDGQAVGARRIGQNFSSDGFFHGRPSAAGEGYDAMSSGASNLGPSNPELIQLAEQRLNDILEENPGTEVADVPIEMITASGSGLDPEIGEQAAILQVPRISRSTGISEERLSELVYRSEKQPLLGLFGEPRVNVLELNLELLKMEGEVEQ